LIWGMKDWCFRPECLERFLRHWPDAEVVRLDDVGHYVIEDDPDRTLAAIKSFIGREQSR
jgi:cis-3-alkyl-4-acyloxetan-2-one decarboxylase